MDADWPGAHYLLDCPAPDWPAAVLHVIGVEGRRGGLCLAWGAAQCGGMRIRITSARVGGHLGG